MSTSSTVRHSAMASLCPVSWGMVSQAMTCPCTCQRRASLHSRMHPEAPWRGWPGQAAGKGPLPSAPAVGWSPRTAPPAWAPAGSHISFHIGQCLPVSVQIYLEKEEITAKLRSLFSPHSLLSSFHALKGHGLKWSRVADVLLFPIGMQSNAPHTLVQWMGFPSATLPGAFMLR